MKKEHTDFQDIYHKDTRLPEETATTHPLQEQMEHELRRRWFFNLGAGLLSVVLIGGVVSALVSQYRFVPEKVVPAVKKDRIFSAYTLPADEQWALEYRQAAAQADASEPVGPKGLSTKWIGNAAYHIIMGEQSLLQDDSAAAKSHLERALVTFPAMTGIHHPLGTVYLKLQYPEKAVEQLEAALAERPSVDILNNLGVAYMDLGKYDRAETFLRQTLQQQPNLAGSQKNLALLYKRAGRTNEAVTAFEKYFQTNPRDTQQLQAYVTYLTEAERIGDAIVFLKGVEGADPLAVHLMLAKAAAQENDVDLAVRSLRATASLQTPRQILAEMHDVVFKKIAQTEPFENLTRQLELASVSLSTNLPGPAGEKN